MTRAATQPRVRLGGSTWLDTLVPSGDLVITQGKHGPYELTASVTLRRRAWRHPLLRSRVRAEVLYGGLLIWGGRINDMDWDAGHFSAEGYHRETEGAACLNAAGRPTSETDTAVDQAIARGVISCRRIDTWGTGATTMADGDATHDDPEGMTLDALLDSRSAEIDCEWRVDAHRRLEQYTDDDAVKWVVPPGVVSMGTATDDRIDRVLLSYRDSGDSDLRRMTGYPGSTPVGGVEAVASVTKTRSITSARADAYAETIYRRMGLGRDGWTNGVTLGPGQLLTPGGQYAHPSHPRSGDKVRLLGIPDPRDGVIGDLTFRIDTAAWDVTARTLQLNPVGMADRSFESIARRVLPKPKKDRSTRAHRDGDGS